MHFFEGVSRAMFADGRTTIVRTKATRRSGGNTILVEIPVLAKGDDYYGYTISLGHDREPACFNVTLSSGHDDTLPSAYMSYVLYLVDRGGCAGPYPVDLPWGTMLLDLTDQIARAWGAATIRVYDMSRIDKCNGQKISFSLYRLLGGEVPWYEKNGYVLNVPNNPYFYTDTYDKESEQITYNAGRVQALVDAYLDSGGDATCMGCVPNEEEDLCSQMCAQATVRDAARLLRDGVDAGSLEACKMMKNLPSPIGSLSDVHRIKFLKEKQRRGPGVAKEGSGAGKRRRATPRKGWR